MRAAMLVLALVLLAPVALAYPDPGKVPLYYGSDCYQTYGKRFVHDYIGLFPDAFGHELEGAACEVYAQTSAHYVVVTVPDTEGETLENYAFHLFEAWGIGDAERLDGLLLLFVNDYAGSGGSALRIDVGYGLEAVVNSRVTDDAWDLMIDARDRALEAGSTDQEARALAIATGSLFLLRTLADSYTEAGFPAPDPRSDDPPLWFWIVVVVAIILLFLLLSRSSGGRRGWGYHAGSAAWGSGYGSTWAPRGGGGFSGGGSFGGGRSGGGGRGGRF